MAMRMPAQRAATLRKFLRKSRVRSDDGDGVPTRCRRSDTARSGLDAYVEAALSTAARATRGHRWPLLGVTGVVVCLSARLGRLGDDHLLQPESLLGETISEKRHVGVDPRTHRRVLDMERRRDAAV